MMSIGRCAALASSPPLKFFGRINMRALALSCKSHHDHIFREPVMPNNAYRTGARFERRVKKHLESLGYFVMRSPGSKSPVDLVVLGHQTKWLVQCKVNGVCGPAEWNALYDASEIAGAIPIVVFRERRKIEWRAVYMKKDRRHKRQPWNAVKVLANDYRRDMSPEEHRTIQGWLHRRSVEDKMSAVFGNEETPEGKVLVGES